jgi:hypothetical protein
MGEFDLKPVKEIGVVFGLVEIGVLIEIKIVVRVDSIVEALFLGMLEINGCFIGVSEGDLAEVVDGLIVVGLWREVGFGVWLEGVDLMMVGVEIGD